jgi:hypothetical protein
MRETRFRMISSVIPDAGMAFAALTGSGKTTPAPSMEFLGQEEGTHGLPLSRSPSSCRACQLKRRQQTSTTLSAELVRECCDHGALYPSTLVITHHCPLPSLRCNADRRFIAMGRTHSEFQLVLCPVANEAPWWLDYAGQHM